MYMFVFARIAGYAVPDCVYCAQGLYSSPRLPTDSDSDDLFIAHN